MFTLYSVRFASEREAVETITMVRNEAPIEISTDSNSKERSEALVRIDGELANILAGIDALKRLSPSEPDAQAARIARAYSRIDEALANAVRQLYENMGDSEEIPSA